MKLFNRSQQYARHINLFLTQFAVQWRAFLIDFLFFEPEIAYFSDSVSTAFVTSTANERALTNWKGLITHRKFLNDSFSRNRNQSL